MNCAYYEDLLSARLDGALTPEEQAQLEAHLETCPACRRYAGDLERLHADLLTLGQEPPAAFAEAILADLGPLPGKPARKPSARRWVPLACAAALALALLGGVPLHWNGGGDSAETAAAEESAPAEPMEGAPAEGGEAAQDFTADMEAKPGASTSSGQTAQREEEKAGSAVLTQNDALAALEDHLSSQGRDLVLEPVGLSADGQSWLFSARDGDGTAAALFSVARDSGQVREIPAA